MEARIVRVLFFMPTMTAVASDNLHLSELAPTFVQSEIRAMNVACAAAKGINMAQGVCDTDPPLPVVDAAIEAIRGGHNIYTRLEGIASLREGLAQKLATFNGLTVDPEREILVTAGATGAMYCTLLALLNPGDECLIFEPFYGYHILTLRSQRIKPVTVPLDAPDWTLDMDRLRAAVTPRTRAIILNSPGNPSGKVFTLAELELLANFAIEHDLFVFTDEMYEYFLYEGAKHISIASLPGMADRTITISGFSKTFSVTGWRLGYLTGSTKWLPAIGNFHDLTSAARCGGRSAAAAGELLHRDGRRVPGEARYGLRCPHARRAHAFSAEWGLLHSGRCDARPRCACQAEGAQAIVGYRRGYGRGLGVLRGECGWQEPRGQPAALLLCEEAGGARRGVCAAGWV
jgi:aminotransferase